MGIFNYDSKFIQYVNKLADLMIVNVLTLVCCLPIITIGSSLTAMHSVVMKIYRNEEHYVAKLFFKAFKENFKRSTAIWLIYLAVFALFLLDMTIFTQSGLGVSKFLEYGLYVVIIMGALSFVWVFILQSRYENKVTTMIKNAILIGVTRPFRSILMVLVACIPTLIVLVYAPIGMPILILFGFTLPGLLQAMLYSKVFDRLEGVDLKAAEMQEEG